MKTLRKLIREVLYQAHAPKRYNLEPIEIDAKNTEIAGDEASKRWFNEKNIRVDPMTIDLKPVQKSNHGLPTLHGSDSATWKAWHYARPAGVLKYNPHSKLVLVAEDVIGSDATSDVIRYAFLSLSSPNGKPELLLIIDEHDGIWATYQSPGAAVANFGKPANMLDVLEKTLVEAPFPKMLKMRDYLKKWVP